MDKIKYSKQEKAVLNALSDGKEHDIDDIARLSGVRHTSIGSRIRDLRTADKGAYNIVTVKDYVYQLQEGYYTPKKKNIVVSVPQPIKGQQILFHTGRLQ